MGLLCLGLRIINTRISVSQVKHALLINESSGTGSFAARYLESSCNVNWLAPRLAILAGCIHDSIVITRRGTPNDVYLSG